MAQEFPTDGLRTPTTSTVLPQTFTGTSTGACTVFPESTPGEPAERPVAPESAWAAPLAAASTPVAAAIVIRPLRVTCRIAEIPAFDLVPGIGVPTDSRCSDVR
ncbi:hypothetical protein RKD28_005831 [Streptomyces sp. SAI-229]